MDIVTVVLLLALAVVAYRQHIVALLDEFELINGPVIYLNTEAIATYRHRELRDVLIRVELGKGSKLSVVYFKAPLYFKEVTPNKQQRLLKRTARISGMRVKTINQIDYVR